MKTFSLLSLASLLVLGASCESDTPSDYPAAATPAPAASGADTQLADAQARIAELEAQQGQAQAQPQAQAPAPRQAPRQASGGSFSLPPNPTATGVYSGPISLVGEVRFCETYDKTSVSGFRGMELCYRANLDQHRDGSLAGNGIKISEETPSSGFRDLPPSEQSPVQISGYVDDTNVIHLEYAVKGARRTSKAVAQYRPTGSPDDYSGSFRTDAANASGRAGLSSY